MLRAVILSGLVVSVLARDEAVNPEDLDFSEIIDQKIWNLWNNHIHVELKKILTICETNDVQQNTIQQSTVTSPPPLVYLEPKFNDMIGAFETKLNNLNMEMEIQLNTIAAKIITDVEKALESVVKKQDLTQTIAELATSSDMTDVKTSLAELQSVTNNIATLSTKDDVTNLQRGVNEIAIALVNVTSCTYKDEFDAVIESITRAEGDINKLENIFNTSLISLENSCVNDVQQSCATDDLQIFLQGNNASLRQNSEDIRGILNSVAEVHNVTARLRTLEGVVRDIYDNTLPPPTPPPTTTPEPTTTLTPPLVPLTPCEDSRFIGDSRSFSVCQTAVRFKKCTMELMSFHCCATCTDAGMLPLVGPHRYLNLSRTVSILEASRALVLAKKTG